MTDIARNISFFRRLLTTHILVDDLIEMAIMHHLDTMLVAINMLVRPRRDVDAAENDSKCQHSYDQLTEHFPRLAATPFNRNRES